MNTEDFQVLLLNRLEGIENKLRIIEDDIEELKSRIGKEEASLQKKETIQSDDDNDEPESFRISRIENKLKRMQSHMMRTKKNI